MEANRSTSISLHRFAIIVLPAYNVVVRVINARLGLGSLDTHRLLEFF